MAAAGASQVGAQGVYIFLAGSDNNGSVTPGGGPPALALLSNAGGNNPLPVVAAPPSVAEPQLIDGQRPLVVNNADQLARTDPVPVIARAYAGVAKIGCAATTLAAMVVGQQPHGQVISVAVGF
jgi:hypothetical protein